VQRSSSFPVPGTARGWTKTEVAATVNKHLERRGVDGETRPKSAATYSDRRCAWPRAWSREGRGVPGHRRAVRHLHQAGPRSRTDARVIGRVGLQERLQADRALRAYSATNPVSCENGLSAHRASHVDVPKVSRVELRPAERACQRDSARRLSFFWNRAIWRGARQLGLRPVLSRRRVSPVLVAQTEAGCGEVSERMTPGGVNGVRSRAHAARFAPGGGPTQNGTRCVFTEL